MNNNRLKVPGKKQQLSQVCNGEWAIVSSEWLIVNSYYHYAPCFKRPRLKCCINMLIYL